MRARNNVFRVLPAIGGRLFHVLGCLRAMARLAEQLQIAVIIRALVHQSDCVIDVPILALSDFPLTIGAPATPRGKELCSLSGRQGPPLLGLEGVAHLCTLGIR